MKRLPLLPLALLFSTTAFAQTNSNDSDTLKSLLSEVRLLRQDLRTTTVAAQRAQILVYNAHRFSVGRRVLDAISGFTFRMAPGASTLQTNSARRYLHRHHFFATAVE